MREFIPMIVMLAALGTAYAGDADAEQYTLKDGSTLYVREDGTMKMVDKNGEAMKMAEGVEMELADGTVMMMKNTHLWRRVGPPGKGRTVHIEQ